MLEVINVVSPNYMELYYSFLRLLPWLAALRQSKKVVCRQSFQVLKVSAFIMVITLGLYSLFVMMISFF